MTNKGKDNEPEEATRGAWADETDSMMKVENVTSQGQAQEDQKMGQALQQDKSQGLQIESEQEQDVEPVKDEEEEPNWNSRDWYWTARGQSTGSSGSAAMPSNATGAPLQRALARIPSQSLVDFLDAMVDLVYQYNLWHDSWDQNTLRDVRQLPAELLPTLGNNDKEMVPGIRWGDFTQALVNCGPYKKHEPWFELIYELTFVFLQLTAMPSRFCANGSKLKKRINVIIPG